MDQIRSTITKILATWVGIGAALAAIGSLGLVPVPELLLNIFSQEVATLLGNVTDVILTTVGVVIAAAQAIRAILIGQQESAGQVSTKSLEDVKALRKSPFATW